jgi:hypothetical protein
VPPADVAMWKELLARCQRCNLDELEPPVVAKKWDVSSLAKRKPVNLHVRGPLLVREVDSNEDVGRADNDVDSGDDEEKDVYDVSKILDYRINEAHMEEYLVRWAPPYNSANEDTWEPLVNLEGCAEAINAFHAHKASGSGLSRGNEAKAELAKQLREHEAAQAGARPMDECPNCHRWFVRLAAHLPKCKVAGK